MSIRMVAATILVVLGCAGADANSCSNVNIMGLYDRTGIDESDYGLNAVGTFRIQGEADESKQPMFNLSQVDCTKRLDDNNMPVVECKVTRASVSATREKPDPDKPNC